MLSHQTAPFPIAFEPALQTASTLWGRAIRMLRRKWEEARQQRIVSNLPPHLRHDIGELDCRPPLPHPLSETLQAHQQTLETMWLRSF